MTFIPLEDYWVMLSDLVEVYRADLKDISRITFLHSILPGDISSA
jgi:hypothetical protein